MIKHRLRPHRNLRIRKPLVDRLTPEQQRRRIVKMLKRAWEYRVGDRQRAVPIVIFNDGFWKRR